MTKKQLAYIYWTCANEEEAKALVRSLLDQRLIACASIFPRVTSLYRWEGKLEEGEEVKVLLKTVATHFSAIETYIKEHSSYDVPEISQIDVSRASDSYLDWALQELR